MAKGAFGEELPETTAQAAAESNADTQTIVAAPPVEAAPAPAAPATEETPAAPVVEVKPEPQIIEKIVEVEKPISFSSPEAEALYRGISENNTEDIFNYLQEQRRDYNTMSDMDIVKWDLRKKNPEWSDKEIDMEIRFKYGRSLELTDLSTIDQDLEPEKYKEAEKRNETIEDKILLLQRDARQGRIDLNNGKKTIQLPKLNTPTTQQPQQKTSEELAAERKNWEDYVEAEMPKLSDYKYNVDGEEVSYKVTDDEKKGMAAQMKGFDAAQNFTELGWRDKDGKLFPEKIAKDQYLIRNIDKIVAAAYSQGKTAGKKETVTNDIKNINLNPQSEIVEPGAVDVWQKVGNKFNNN